MKKMRHRPDFLSINDTLQAIFFYWILMGSLSYLYSMQFIFHKSQLNIFFFNEFID